MHLPVLSPGGTPATPLPGPARTLPWKLLDTPPPRPPSSYLHSCTHLAPAWTGPQTVDSSLLIVHAPTHTPSLDFGLLWFSTVPQGPLGVAALRVQLSGWPRWGLPTAGREDDFQFRGCLGAQFPPTESRGPFRVYTLLSPGRSPQPSPPTALPLTTRGHRGFCLQRREPCPARLSALAQIDSRVGKRRGAETRGRPQWAIGTTQRAVLKETPGHPDTQCCDRLVMAVW